MKLQNRHCAFVIVIALCLASCATLMPQSNTEAYWSAERQFIQAERTIRDYLAKADRATRAEFGDEVVPHMREVDTALDAWYEIVLSEGDPALAEAAYRRAFRELARVALKYGIVELEGGES